MAGLVLEAVCGLLAVWERRQLDAQWCGEITRKVEHRLIRSRPYRAVRHPIYTAWRGTCAGPAIASGQLHALLAMAMVAFAYWHKIRTEEATLQEGFGPVYAAYRRDAWALIPWLF